MALPAIIATVALQAGAAVIQNVLSGGGGRPDRPPAGYAALPSGPGDYFTPGANIQVLPPGTPGAAPEGLSAGEKLEYDPKTGVVSIVKRRRRRRRMLTCQDKSDIAFLTGTLGKGEMGRTAISSLLARCR